MIAWLDTLRYETSSDFVSLMLGLGIGLMFGVFAQQSRFCLRAACIEFWRGQPGPKFAIWLITFGSALFLTQLAIEGSGIDTSIIRQLNNAGSLSGAIIGGLLFGVGMVLSRGCASRLLVLSATGNLRALVAGLLVTVVAQAAFRGALTPLRENVSSWWMVDAHLRGLSRFLPDFGGLILGALTVALALWLLSKNGVSRWASIAAAMTGASVSLAWLLTSQYATVSFDIVPVQSVSFTGPSADTLMGFINERSLSPSFDIGLVPGVFAGSGLAALLSHEFGWQGFTVESGTGRYLVGATLMGFGAMCAGGCAVGAGVSGGSLLLGTAWVALFFMWLGAGLADWLVDRKAFCWRPRATMREAV